MITSSNLLQTRPTRSFYFGWSCSGRTRAAEVLRLHFSESSFNDGTAHNGTRPPPSGAPVTAAAFLQCFAVLGLTTGSTKDLTRLIIGAFLGDMPMERDYSFVNDVETIDAKRQ